MAALRTKSLLLIAVALVITMQKVFAQPASGLVAFYPLDGNANDASNNVNIGTAYGATAAVDRFGNAGRALAFDGVSSYVRIPRTSWNQPGAGSFSICGWFQVSSVDVTKSDFYIYDMDDGDSDYSGYSMYWDTQGEGLILDFHYDDAWTHHTGVITSAATLRNGWHFFTGILDRNLVQMRLYVDGSLVGSHAIDPQSITSTRSDFYLGRRPYIPPYEQLFNGSLDDIRIYNRPLDDSEIRSLYNEGGYQPPTTPEIWEPAGSFSSRLGKLAVDAHDRLYVGSESVGLLRSTDSGNSWTSVNPGGMTYRDALPAFNPVTRTLFLSGDDSPVKMFRTSDAGEAWQQLTLPWTSYVRSFAFNSLGHVFVGTNSQGVWRSTNNGETWVQKSNGITEPIISPLYVDRFDNLYAGTRRLWDDYNGGFVFRSTDNGESWQPILSNVGPVYALARRANGSIFVGCDSRDFKGIYRSTDNGLTWLQVNTGLDNPRIYCLLVGANDEIIVPSSGDGVHKSTDNGETWDSFNSGITDVWFASIVSNSREQMFVSSWPGHVFRTKQVEIAPTIECQANIVAQNISGRCDQSVLFTASASGIPAPTVVYTIGSTVITSPHTFPVGTTTVNCTATNGIGSPANCSFTVTVIDDQPPTITGASDIAVRPTSLAGAVVTYLIPEAEDNCPGVLLQQTEGLPSDAQFPIGTTLNTFVATDASGHIATYSFNVTVLDPYCGTKKVNVCHNGHTICVSVNALPAHLAHGDLLGPCDLGKAGEPIAEIPDGFILQDNYPNPFNPSTTIRFGIPTDANVHLAVYNTLGEKVAQLVAGELNAGYHEVLFDASQLASGLYIYRMQAGDYVSSRKLILLK